MTAHMTEEQARRVAKEMLPEIEAAVGSPCASWGNRCHEVSLKIVRTGLLGQARVARGWADGVRSQHSWIVLGDDVYDEGALIADPTLWFHRRGEEPGIVVIPNSMTTHRPRGSGSIWEYGAPPDAEPGGEIWLPRCLSEEAEAFLMACGPLDRRGWMFLANAPVQEWPAREIIEAICEAPELGPALVHVDILGHLTDRNPGGMYW